MTTSRRPCKDCLAELVGAAPPKAMRPAPHPGPRCATHHRAVVIQRRQAAQQKRRLDIYGLDAHSHAALLVIQGGACAICRKAKGLYRALAVDHDHAQARLDGHDHDKGCPKCVRGLLCKRCNRILGEWGDEPTTFETAAQYLRHWPSRDLPMFAALNASAASGSPSAAATSSAAGAAGWDA